MQVGSTAQITNVVSASPYLVPNAGTSFSCEVLDFGGIAVRLKPDAPLLAVDLIVEAQHFPYQLQQLVWVFFVPDQIMQRGDPHSYLWVHSSRQSDLEDESERLEAINAASLTC